MAKLVSFMMSSLAQNIPNPAGGMVQQLTNPLIVLRPRYIPSEYSFSIIFGINDFDLAKENTLRIVLRTPGNETLIDTGDGKLPATSTDALIPKEFQGAVLSAPFQNVEFKDEGVYHLEVIFNGESLGTQDIPVFRLGTGK